MAEADAVASALVFRALLPPHPALSLGEREDTGPAPEKFRRRCHSLSRGKGRDHSHPVCPAITADPFTPLRTWKLSAPRWTKSSLARERCRRGHFAVALPDSVRRGNSAAPPFQPGGDSAGAFPRTST